MLVKLSVDEFGRVLASDAPAPGGGSVAALSGALGADLIAMVCRLSVGRQDLELFADELSKALNQATDLSKSLLERVDLDTQAFNSVMAAFKLPKQTEEEKKKRGEAIQAGYREAIQSPLGIARECLQILQLAESLVGKSNPNALSDLGVASQQAYAGLEGAIMNVKINIPSIKDESFKTKTSDQVDKLLEDGRRAKDAVYSYVCRELG
ncbi:MAG: cyclodeaminase/cyclohydrolase family protein [Novosphingobium sp.]|nr:cyclodeaminase/cyclohydrolase family protein [Novosphingobium sp.]